MTMARHLRMNRIDQNQDGTTGKQYRDGYLKATDQNEVLQKVGEIYLQL